MADPGGPIRLYLTNTTSPLPALTPAGAWEQTAGAARGLLGRTPAGANTSVTVAETSTSATFDVLLGQWVSEPLTRAGTIEGTAAFVVPRSESDPAADLVTFIAVSVVDGPGTTVRGGNTQLFATEWPTTTTAVAGTVTVLPVAALAGDRIVVEYGYRATNTVATNYTGTIRYGGAASAVPLAGGDTGAVAETLPPHVTFNGGADLFEQGTPFMQTTLGAGARLAVEVAWGADLAAAASTWLWSDVTGDVRMTNQIAIAIGRGDEATQAQPATATFTLDNRAGAYSQGGQCPNWPYVRANTPVRVRVLLPAATAWKVRFFGYATAWTPAWDTTGNDATTQLTAAGTLRRLQQGTSPILSSLRRVLTDSATVRAYWPCEDPAGSTSLVSALPAHPPMAITGDAELPYPKFATNTSAFVCSAALPEVNGTVWRGVVPPYTHTGDVMVRWLVGAPDQMTVADQTILSLYTAGTVARWDVRYGAAAGGIAIDAYDTAGASVLGTGAVGFNVNDTTRRYSLNLEQSGADIAWSFNTLTAGDSASGGGTGGTIAAQTLGRATAVVINPSGLITDTVIGHICVQDFVTAISTDEQQLNGNARETVATRLTRLAAENGLAFTVASTAPRAMGPQPVAPLLTLLSECEVVDQGALVDGLNDGLTYVPYDYRRDRPADLTLNAPGGDLARAIEPVDDDQRTVNSVTVERLRGATVTETDTDGPRGAAAIGVYDTSVKASLFFDVNAIDLAGWLVGLGTVEGYRHPHLSLDLARNPALATNWVALLPGSRIDVTGIEQVRTQHPAGTVSLMLEGWTESIDQFLWNVDATCSPYTPWRVALAAADTADTGEFIGRATAGTSTLAATAVAAATSLSVATPAGDPLWTTDADDYPLYVDVGGIRVTATACTGASSPQTLTVTGATVTKALAAGLGIDLWGPTPLGK